MLKNLRFPFLVCIGFFYFPLFGQKFISSNLPIIIIDTHGREILDDPKISADMGIIDNGAGSVNHVTDSYNNFSGKIGIEIRGSSSQSFPKKQYGIEVQDASGNGKDVSLLGMPKKDDWILFAAYDDKSLMRDALAYKLGRAQGRYASRSRYCEVMLNGQYQGVYVLLEKIKRDKNRVNIAKLDPTSTTGDIMTGGYIIKLDKATGSGGDGWASTYPPLHRLSNQTIYFLYDYPKQEDIIPEQKNYIKNYVDAFEVALAGIFFRDPDQGYAKYVDVDSFVDFYLMMEVTKNVDGYRLSTYLYKDKDSNGGKLRMGPIWDFNEGFGNANYCTQGNPEGFVTDFNTLCPNDYWLIPFWWNRLFQDPLFNQKVKSRWADLRQGAFQTTAILNYVDSVSNVLSMDSAQQRNFTKWPILGQYVWPNYYVGNSYVSEVTWLKNWITQRLAWLDNNISLLITAVEKNPASFIVKMFPNPFSEDVTVEYEMAEPGTMRFELYNVMGKKMESVELLHEAKGQYQWNYHSGFPAGTYILRSQVGNSVQVTRLVKSW
jgi:hypothetical protein